MKTLNCLMLVLCVLFAMSCSKTDEGLRETPKAQPADEITALSSPEDIYEIISQYNSEIALSDVQDMMQTRDINQDCLCFSSSDLSAFLPCFRAVSGDCLCHDYNEGGFVDIQDLQILLANFENCSAEILEVDIAPLWNNWAQDIGAKYTSFQLDLFPQMISAGCTWDEVKANCCVEWYWTDILVSTDKDGLNLHDAINDYGAFNCKKYQPITVRITHNPTGRIFERTNCGNYSHHILGNGNDLPLCDLGCDGFEAMTYTGFTPFEFCTNCN